MVSIKLQDILKVQKYREGGKGLDGVVSNKLQDIFKVQKCREGGEGLDGVVRV